MMTVALLAAVSADGFIARSHDELADWTSKEDKRFFVEKTTEAGVIIMGRRTYETIGRGLKNRVIIVMSRASAPEVLPEGVVWTNESPRELVARLEGEGRAMVTVCGGSSIYGVFAREGLLTDCWLTIEPICFGRGIRLFDELTRDLRLTLVETRPLSEQAIALHYKVA